MARTRKSVEEEYARRVYVVYSKYEKVIDETLVHKFRELRSDGLLKLRQKDIEGSYSQSGRTFATQYEDALIELIKENYKDWKIEYDTHWLSFTFFYTPQNETFMSLFGNLEDRFGAMQIGDENEDVEEYENEEVDDIPF